jgi:acetyltransferase-like isoleucine patch superfamily enzyme
MTNSTVHEKFKKTTRKKVVIGKHVIIGANTVIFPGCTIKEGTSVGAMSLINQNTKNWGVYFGIPAKLKKKRKIIPKILINKFLKFQK